MARFGNCRLIPNFIPRTLSTSLYTITVQDKEVAAAEAAENA